MKISEYLKDSEISAADLHMAATNIAAVGMTITYCLTNDVEFESFVKEINFLKNNVNILTSGASVMALKMLMGSEVSETTNE